MKCKVYFTYFVLYAFVFLVSLLILFAFSLSYEMSNIYAQFQIDVDQENIIEKVEKKKSMDTRRAVRPTTKMTVPVILTPMTSVLISSMWSPPGSFGSCGVPSSDASLSFFLSPTSPSPPCVSLRPTFFTWYRFWENTPN